jgi:chromate transport protein ChrA
MRSLGCGIGWDLSRETGCFAALCVHRVPGLLALLGLVRLAAARAHA